MTIRHLQIFKAVAEAGKMGQAARQLYISQPTVSKAIGDLEKEYGVLLFDRLAQKLYITEAGTRLLRYARQLLALYDEMEADLHAAAGLQAIRVGATITVGSCVLPALIRRFEQEHPGVRVQVEVESARRDAPAQKAADRRGCGPGGTDSAGGGLFLVCIRLLPG